MRSNLEPVIANLESKATTQADLETDWAAYWASEYKIPLLFHRKLWEVFYCTQALYERGCLVPKNRGLGFGCGGGAPTLLFRIEGSQSSRRPMHRPAMWARNTGCKPTSIPSSLDSLFKPELIAREAFDANIEHRFVDMNAIPDDLRDFDFCWSMCAFEHLGTIARGLDFVENSIATLKPGGVAVHTTEFSFFDDKEHCRQLGHGLLPKETFPRDRRETSVKRAYWWSPWISMSATSHSTASSMFRRLSINGAKQRANPGTAIRLI